MILEIALTAQLCVQAQSIAATRQAVAASRSTACIGPSYPASVPYYVVPIYDPIPAIQDNTPLTTEAWPANAAPPSRPGLTPILP